MAVQSSDNLLAMFDSAPLNRRYWVTFAVMSGVLVLDFFDFFLIAFVMSVIGGEWHLTYGQGALILYGAGVGAIIGSLVSGALGDLFGRKMQTVIGTFICGISAGLIGFVPTGAWVILAILRFFVGFGLAAGVTPALTIVVEMTPTRWRTGMTSFFIVFASAGTLLSSFTAATLLHAFGWRGVAATGFVAVIIGILVWILVPESVRWLTAKGRFAEARAEVANQLELPLDQVPLPTIPPDRATARQPHGTLFGQSAAVLADDPHLGRLRVGGLWILSVGTDHCRPGAPPGSRPRPPNTFIYVSGTGDRRQDHRLADRLADGAARPRHSVRVRVGRLSRAGRVFQRRRWSAGSRCSSS